MCKCVSSIYILYIYIIICLRTVGCIGKSITICSCACILGINAGMLLLTNRFNIYFLWELFPSWIDKYQKDSICYHIVIYCLFLHCHPLSCHPWCWTWEAFFMDQVFGKVCFLDMFLFLRFCALCWMYFFPLNCFGHQFNNSGTEFDCC